MPRRTDNKGRAPKIDESQRKDLLYQYRYTDNLGKRQTVYAATLQEPRQKEAEIDAYIKWRELRQRQRHRRRTAGALHHPQAGRAVQYKGRLQFRAESGAEGALRPADHPQHQGVGRQAVVHQAVPGGAQLQHNLQHPRRTETGVSDGF